MSEAFSHCGSKAGAGVKWPAPALKTWQKYSSLKARINTEINAPEVRLIGASGEQVGVVSLAAANKLAEEAEHVRRLMTRYSGTPMSLADACLVRLTEQRRQARVLTLDSDFRRYRRLGRQVIPLIAPK
jgi:hypothetical protein